MSVITRANIDELLDRRLIEVRMRDRAGDKPGTQHWWQIRRNGQTWHGKRDPKQLRIPVKAGLKTYGRITEADFAADGTLDPKQYRIKGG